MDKRLGPAARPASDDHGLLYLNKQHTVGKKHAARQETNREPSQGRRIQRLTVADFDLTTTERSLRTKHRPLLLRRNRNSELPCRFGDGFRCDLIKTAIGLRARAGACLVVLDLMV